MVSNPSGWTKVGRLRPSQSRAWPLEGKVGFPSLGLVGEEPLESGKLGMDGSWSGSLPLVIGWILAGWAEGCQASQFLKVKVLVMCDSFQPTDCSLPSSSVHGISQASILEWVAIPFFRSSQPKNTTRVSGIAGRFFTI